MQAVRQVVFTDALIIGGLYVDGQSFAPIGLHKTDSSSLGRYVFGSEISYNKAPPRLPGLAC